MSKENLTTQAKNFATHLTIEDLPAEIVELSDEALSQVCGGRGNHKVIRLQRLNSIDAPENPELYNNPMITPETNPELYHPGIF